MTEGMPSWGFIFTTLIIRFVGVFFVLAILQIGMQISGWVIRRFPAGGEKAGESGPVPELADETVPEAESVAPGVLGAMTVGLHLYMEEKARAARGALDSDSVRPVESSAWQAYGRREQFDSRKIVRPW